MEEGPTKFCSNCEKQILESKFFLHERFCAQNVKKCQLCGEVINIEDEEDHIDEKHTDIECEQCKEKFPKDIIQEHYPLCPCRVVTCRYCGLEVIYKELDIHESQCGAKTEQCPKCLKYIPRKDYEKHQQTSCVDTLIYQKTSSDSEEKFKIVSENNIQEVDKGKLPKNFVDDANKKKKKETDRILKERTKVERKKSDYQKKDFHDKYNQRMKNTEHDILTGFEEANDIDNYLYELHKDDYQKKDPIYNQFSQMQKKISKEHYYEKKPKQFYENNDIFGDDPFHQGDAFNNVKQKIYDKNYEEKRTTAPKREILSSQKSKDPKRYIHKDINPIKSQVNSFKGNPTKVKYGGGNGKGGVGSALSYGSGVVNAPKKNYQNLFDKQVKGVFSSKSNIKKPKTNINYNSQIPERDIGIDKYNGKLYQKKVIRKPKNEKKENQKGKENEKNEKPSNFESGMFAGDYLPDDVFDF